VSDGRKDRSDGGKTESSTQKRALKKNTNYKTHKRRHGLPPKDEHEEGNNLTWPGDTTHTTKPTKHKKTTGAAVEEQHKLSLAIIRRSTKTKNENNTHTHTHIMETAAVDALQQSSVL
jgi:hypothetical protein